MNKNAIAINAIFLYVRQRYIKKQLCLCNNEVLRFFVSNSKVYLRFGDQ